MPNLSSEEELINKIKQKNFVVDCKSSTNNCRVWTIVYDTNDEDVLEDNPRIKEEVPNSKAVEFLLDFLALLRTCDA